MNNKLKIFYLIVMIVWLFMISYLIINEEWLSLVKNLLIFIISFVGGRIYATIKRRL